MTLPFVAALVPGHSKYPIAAFSLLHFFAFFLDFGCNQLVFFCGKQNNEIRSLVKPALPATVDTVGL
jgi:hypothetical protein